MSGSSGSEYYPSVGRKSKDISCEAIAFSTVLTKPNIEVIKMLNVGDVLVVDFKDGELIAINGSERVGNIETSNNSDIINCIALGTFYIAEVLNIKDGVCRIKVKAQSL